MTDVGPLEGSTEIGWMRKSMWAMGSVSDSGRRLVRQRPGGAREGLCARPAASLRWAPWLGARDPGAHPAWAVIAVLEARRDRGRPAHPTSTARARRKG